MVGVVQLAEHRIVVPGVVGSSPITHPIKNEDTIWYPRFLYGYSGVMGLERPTPVRTLVGKVSGGTLRMWYSVLFPCILRAFSLYFL